MKPISTLKRKFIDLDILYIQSNSGHITTVASTSPPSSPSLKFLLHRSLRKEIS